MEMKLDEFVKETLLNIIKGVHEAKKEYDIDGAKINPPVNASMSDNTIPLSRYIKNGDKRYNLIEHVEFDLTISVEEVNSKEGKAGLFVKGIGAGGSKGSEYKNTSEQNIKFKVPVKFPNN